MEQIKIETLITNIDARTTRTEKRMTGIEERVTRIEERVTGIEERTTSIEQILPTLATKDDVRAEGERTRRHFDVVAGQMKADIALIAEGHQATKVYVEEQLADSRATLQSHDKRIMKLEAKSMNAGAKPKRRSTRRDPS